MARAGLAKTACEQGTTLSSCIMEVRPNLLNCFASIQQYISGTQADFISLHQLEGAERNRFRRSGHHMTGHLALHSRPFLWEAVWHAAAGLYIVCLSCSLYAGNTPLLCCCSRQKSQHCMVPGPWQMQSLAVMLVRLLRQVCSAQGKAQKLCKS